MAIEREIRELTNIKNKLYKYEIMSTERTLTFFSLQNFLTLSYLFLTLCHLTKQGEGNYNLGDFAIFFGVLRLISKALVSRGFQLFPQCFMWNQNEALTMSKNGTCRCQFVPRSKQKEDKYLGNSSIWLSILCREMVIIMHASRCCCCVLSVICFACNKFFVMK